MKYLLCFALIAAVFGTSYSYVTADNKQVPALPIPAGATVYPCSNFVSLYMNIRNHMAPNTCFLIKDGTYAFNTITVNISADHVYFIGESGDPSKVILTSNGFFADEAPDFDFFHIANNAHHVIFANITISETRQYAVKFNGLTNMGNILWHNVRFINNATRDIKGVGLMEAPACTVRYCHFENTKIPLITRCSDGSCASDGDYIAGMDIMSADSWAIHDSYFKNILGASGGGRAGVFMWNLCRNVWTERNTFVNCDRSVAYGNYSSGEISHDSSYIMNNFILPGAGNAIELYYTRRVRVFNNTLYGATTTGSIIYGNASGGGANTYGEIKNNILNGSISNQNATAPDTATNILVSRGNAAILARWFPNAATGDFHFSSDTCRPLNRGTALAQVTLDWDNAPRIGTLDIGADEYNNNTPIQFMPEEITTIQEAYLSPASPNPFNPVTCVRYGIATAEAGTPCEIAILSLEGRLIRTLRSGPAFPGTYAIQWDAKDDNGFQVASGAYLIWLTVGSKGSTTRAVFMK